MSLGQLNSPEVKNEELIVEYRAGKICFEGMVDTSTRIKFECADVKSDLKFISKNHCTYNFIWKTKYACPKKIPREINICSFRNSLNKT